MKIKKRTKQISLAYMILEVTFQKVNLGLPYLVWPCAAIYETFGFRTLCLGSRYSCKAHGWLLCEFEMSWNYAKICVQVFDFVLFFLSREGRRKLSIILISFSEIKQEKPQSCFLPRSPFIPYTQWSRVRDLSKGNIWKVGKQGKTPSTHS